MANEHTHEMRFITLDREKIVRFAGGDAPMHWADLYNSAALVNNDEEPDQLADGNVLVGSIEVPAIAYAEAVRIMVEDAGLISGKVEKALREETRVSLVV